MTVRFEFLALRTDLFLTNVTSLTGILYFIKYRPTKRKFKYKYSFGSNYTNINVLY